MKIRAYATMYIRMVGEFEAPDNLHPDELHNWVRENADGEEFYQTGEYDWEHDWEVEILEENE